MLDDKKKDLKNVILERVNEQIAAEVKHISQIPMKTVTHVAAIEKYEDEYDDTYDSQAVGSEEPDAHGEGGFARPFVVPRVLQSNVEVEDDEDDDGSPEQPAVRPRDQFVTNPAELRELAEQRRMNRRGYRRPGPTPAQRDVVGKPPVHRFLVTSLLWLFNYRCTPWSRPRKRHYYCPATQNRE